MIDLVILSRMTSFLAPKSSLSCLPQLRTKVVVLLPRARDSRKLTGCPILTRPWLPCASLSSQPPAAGRPGLTTPHVVATQQAPRLLAPSHGLAMGYCRPARALQGPLHGNTHHQRRRKRDMYCSFLYELHDALNKL